MRGVLGSEHSALILPALIHTDAHSVHSHSHSLSLFNHSHSHSRSHSCTPLLTHSPSHSSISLPLTLPLTPPPHSPSVQHVLILCQCDLLPRPLCLRSSSGLLNTATNHPAVRLLTRAPRHTGSSSGVVTVGCCVAVQCDIVGGDAVPPPQLPADAPVTDVFKPAVPGRLKLLFCWFWLCFQVLLVVVVGFGAGGGVSV